MSSELPKEKIWHKTYNSKSNIEFMLFDDVCGVVSLEEIFEMHSYSECVIERRQELIFYELALTCESKKIVESKIEEFGWW